MGCHVLLQGIFPTQGWKHLLHLLRWQVDSVQLSHLGSPNVTALGQFLSCWGHLGCAVLSVEIIVQGANMAAELALDL